MAGYRNCCPDTGGGTGPGVQAVYLYLEAGAWYAVARGYGDDGVWVDVGDPVALTSVAGGGKVSLSGTDLTIASGAADKAKPDPSTLSTDGQAWYVALADLDVPSFDIGALLRLDLLCDSRPTTAYGYVFAGLLTGAWSSWSQTHIGGAISYTSNKAVHYVVSSGNYGTLASPDANFDRLAVELRSQINDAQWGYRNTAGSAGGGFPAITGTPGTSAVTHIGISAGSVYGITPGPVVFGNPRVLFSWTPAAMP